MGRQRRSSVVVPRSSVCQEEFFRVREKERTLYPSSCYAIPDTSALVSSPVYKKLTPLLFVGVDVAEFNEADPSTNIDYIGEEVRFSFILSISIFINRNAMI